jgi:serine/threonine protein kinase
MAYSSTSSKSSASSGSQGVIAIKHTEGFIATGCSGHIYKVDHHHVVKWPILLPEAPANVSYNLMRRDMISTEAKIYERLGQHEGVIQYFGSHDVETGAIKLAYANQGDLSTYIPKHREPSQEDRAHWIRLLARTFFYFYSRRVLHQDIKPSNVLVSKGTLKITDFANSALFSLDDDMEDICARDPLSRVDLLGVGCVFYSIAAWKVFSYDYFEPGRWPTPEELPPTDGILCEDIIQKCWQNTYSSMKPLYEDVVALLG